MIPRFRSGLTLLALGLASGAQALDAQTLWQQAEQLQLATSTNWRQLLYYQPQGWRGSSASEISSETFFLAADGRTQPEHELRALINALTQPGSAAANQAAQCRFPARSLWLSQALSFDLDALPAVECPERDYWRQQGNIDSVSLIWANGFLGNPSSLYGHVLLRLNYASDDPQSQLGRTVNFGVDLPSGEAPVSYIAKGLTGRYQAVFSYAEFYQNSLLYNEYQQRDLWEYRLRLPPDKLAILIDHTWELLGQEFDYYFSRENCAFRTAQVLDLVLEQPLGNRIKPWMMPQDIFNQIVGQRMQGQPLVSHTHFIASGMSRFKGQWLTLARSEQRLVSQFVRQPQPELIEQLPPLRQAIVLDALLEYYQSLAALRPQQQPEPDTLQALQRLRLAQPISPEASASELALQLGQQPPHLGQNPSLLALSGFHNSNLGPGVEGRFRLSYFDQLAPNTGRLPFFEMAMFDLRLAANNEQLWLRRADLIHFEALNISDTGLAGDGGLAWKLRLGSETAHLGCQGCYLGLAEAGLGKAQRLGSDSALYGLAEGRLATGEQGPLSMRLRSGLILGWEPWFKGQLDVGYRWFAQPETPGEPMGELILRLGPGTEWELRLAAASHQAQEYRLGGYWHW